MSVSALSSGGPTKIRRQWTPHPDQNTILKCPARFRVAACGRRFGKTEMARHDLFAFSISVPDQLVWWIGTSYDDANELGFDPLYRMFRDASLLADYRRKMPRYLVLVNGTKISFRSADRPESLQGRGVDYTVIDEAGDVNDDTYYSDIRPTVTDTGGDILLIGTPTGRNYFYNLFQRGQNPDIPDTASFQFTSYDNPHVPNYEIDQARDQQPERVFKQEYLAIFATAEGAVFQNVWNRNCITYDLSRYQGDAPYRIGVDLGRQKNYAAISVLDKNARLAHFERMRRTSWALIENTIVRVASNYRPAKIRMDATRDNQIVENIEGAVPHTEVEPVSFGGKTKNNLIENLAARFELGDIMLPDRGEALDIILSELRTYQYETTRADNIRYKAASGNHDDAVDSLALAAQPGERIVSSGTWGRQAGRSAATDAPEGYQYPPPAASTVY